MAGLTEEYTAEDLAADIEEVPYVEHELDLDDQRIRRDEQKEEAEDGGFMPSSQGSSSSEGSSWCSASDCSLSGSSQGSNRQTDDDDANEPAAAQAQEQEPDVDYDSDADTAMETYEYGLEHDADREAGFGSQEPTSSQERDQEYDVGGDSDTAMEVQSDDGQAPPPFTQPAAQPDPAALPSVFTGFRLLRLAELYRRVMQPELSGWRADWYELAGILYDLNEVQTDYVRYLMDRLGTRASENVLHPGPENEAWILHVAGIHWPRYLESLTDTVEEDLAPGPS
ncbi:uncharacterized protein TRAVEDRAFT_62108 [Trametes versicolor FP-101664 SS1]|uniref:uncharacterized protein n=1 Tax=Trametes versicolor (strain FP-101664) TaxID=717944 RepID=UPI0004623210|nr:uncharacterized protein TRAVEDRAFT_62108 [Trametes versicolor FP-101664 SS1]EIW64563.1 hypothetical protein TRAVEDRAFT_62108 [Trametes versicolor FP-101664 SS1]